MLAALAVMAELLERVPTAMGVLRAIRAAPGILATPVITVLVVLVGLGVMLAIPALQAIRATPVTTVQAALVGRKATLATPEVLATPAPQAAAVAVVAALAVIRG